jgi:hypothetical protein
LQFELGSTRTAYQANINQYNITETGIPPVHYLYFDGIDDWMATGNINFSTTDAVTAWVGIRKLSDTAFGIVFELTSDTNTNNGSFSLLAPAAAGAATYGWRTRGTIIAPATSGNNVPAPNMAVLTVRGVINSDVGNLRRNAIQIANSTGDQGVGNYANAPLFIGRRNGTLNPFNGNLYSLIIRGGVSSTNQITLTETHVNTKTGAY